MSGPPILKERVLGRVCIAKLGNLGGHFRILSNAHGSGKFHKITRSVLSY